MNNHFHLKDVSAINIKNKLDSTLGEPASSFITVKQWVAGSMEDQILVKTNYKIALDHNLAEIVDIPKKYCKLHNNKKFVWSTKISIRMFSHFLMHKL